MSRRNLGKLILAGISRRIPGEFRGSSSKSGGDDSSDSSAPPTPTSLPSPLPSPSTLSCVQSASLGLSQMVLEDPPTSEEIEIEELEKARAEKIFASMKAETKWKLACYEMTKFKGESPPLMYEEKMMEEAERREIIEEEEVRNDFMTLKEKVEFWEMERLKNVNLAKQYDEDLINEKENKKKKGKKIAKEIAKKKKKGTSSSSSSSDGST